MSSQVAADPAVSGSTHKKAPAEILADQTGIESNRIKIIPFREGGEQKVNIYFEDGHLRRRQISEVVRRGGGALSPGSDVLTRLVAVFPKTKFEQFCSTQ